MPICDTTLETAEDGWQYLGWTFFTAFVVIIGYMFMDIVHYTFLKAERYLLPYELNRIVYLFLVVTGSFAAWRVWSCGGWDVTEIPLLLYVIQVIVFALNIPMLFATRNYIVSTVWSFITLLLTVAVLVFFFFEDTWAGVCYIVHTIYAVYWFGANVYIVVDRVRLLKERKDSEKEIRKAHKERTSDLFAHHEAQKMMKQEATGRAIGAGIKEAINGRSSSSKKTLFDRI